MPALGVGQTPPALQVLLWKPVGRNAQIDASWALRVNPSSPPKEERGRGQVREEAVSHNPRETEKPWVRPGAFGCCRLGWCSRAAQSAVQGCRRDPGVPKWPGFAEGALLPRVRLCREASRRAAQRALQPRGTALGAPMLEARTRASGQRPCSRRLGLLSNCWFPLCPQAPEERSTFRVKQRDTDKAHSLFGTSEGTGLERTVRSAFDCSDRREFMENGDRLLSPAGSST